ncbi:spore coat protein U domain-containing protein [Oleisolibacter albus]|uniref:spore coat protein U domain-containing protein n=1 Tax=Oleisolibacter albus TaxID=2171757 RepID=UPI000DF42943|nr:spore coat protein U domain-containing protein [Oleisolibacter albus]
MPTVTKTLLAALIATAALATPAFAQSASGTIRLNGTVALTCTVAVADANQSLNLLSGENEKVVGTVTENCNGAQGYRISLSSSNNGRLKSGNNAIDYQVKYENQGGSLGGTMVVDRGNAQFDKRVDLKVTVPANAQAIAGAYTDTVTIQIAAK